MDLLSMMSAEPARSVALAPPPPTEQPPPPPPCTISSEVSSAPTGLVQSASSTVAPSKPVRSQSPVVPVSRPAPPAFSDDDTEEDDVGVTGAKSDLSSITSADGNDEEGATAQTEGEEEEEAAAAEDIAESESDVRRENRSPSTAGEGSSPSTSSPPPAPRAKPSKRIDEAEANPDLYGLRRSGRAPKKVYVDSSSDQDGDSDGGPRRSRAKGKRSAARSSKGKGKVSVGTFQSASKLGLDGSSEDDEFSTRKRKSKSNKRRLQKRGTSEDDSNWDAARISSRNGKALPNYNEDNYGLALSSDDDPFEDHAKRWVKTGAVEDAEEEEEEEEEETIELVCGHARDEEHVDDKDDEPTRNLLYTIKWKGYSHLHDTYENYEFLKRFKGFKRVENYIKTVIVPQQEMLADSEASHEQLEQLQIDIERQREMVESYKVAERILDQRDSPPSSSRPYTHLAYFCKWKGLSYAQSTWEAEEDIKADSKAAIDAYLARSTSRRVPPRSETYPRGRPKYTRMTEQPVYLNAGGELKPFQMTGLNWLAYLWSTGKNGILADEMGLGKTVQTVAFLSYLFHSQHQYGPFLVVVPLSTLPAWMQQFEVWAPDMNVVNYTGDTRSRATIREYEFGPHKKLRFNVLVTTYEFALKDRADLGSIKWAFLAVDEAHRLKNSGAQLYECLMSFVTDGKLLITGTPLQNNLKELIALLHFLRPDEFALEQPDFDVNEVDQALVKELHAKLDNVMIRRLKKDVVKEMPGKTEKILRVEMSAMQQRMYKTILARNFTALAGSGQPQFKLLNIAIELKKASNHPYLFEGAETETDKRAEILKGLVMHSGKMVLLDKLLTRLKQDGHRVLIFSQMVRMLDILSDYMQMRGYVFQRLDGTITSDVRKKAIEHFNGEGSPDFAFLLSTRAGGLGINLETADTVIIFDSDWNPQNDLQAMARAHRLNSKKHVSVFRLVTKDTVEEDVLERAKRKMILEYAVINHMDTSGSAYAAAKQVTKTKPDGQPFGRDELGAILKFGAEKMFKSDNEAGQQKKLDDMDLDDILSHAEAHETEVDPAGASAGGEAFLQQFAQVQDFKADLSWEDIIPLEERQKAEEEERQKAVLEAAAASSSRRRAAQLAPGTYEGPPGGAGDDTFKDDKDEDDDGPGDSSRKVIPRGPRKSQAERSVSLSERDIRVLIRGIHRWGDLRWRYDIIAEESKLTSKNRATLLGVSDELIKACEDAVAANEQDLKAFQDGGGELTSNQRQKAVMVTCRGVTTNADTTLTRHNGLRLLAQKLAEADAQLQWKVPVKHLKATINWAAGWDPDDDARLLLGIHKHGFGGWEQIEADATLGLASKIFLDEGKRANDPKLKDTGTKDSVGAEGPLNPPPPAAEGAEANGDDAKAGKPKAKGPAPARPIPNAIHLVRRGDYLLKALCEAEEERMLAENGGPAKSSVKKVKRSSPSRSNASPAPSTSKPKKPATKNGDAPKKKGAVADLKKKDRASTSTPSRDTGHETDASELSHYDSMDEAQCKEWMRPCKKQLKKLRDTEKLDRVQKVKVLKECMTTVGGRINELLGTEFKDLSQEDRDRWSRHLWTFSAFFWPKPVRASKLRAIFNKLVDQAATAPATTASASAKRKASSSDPSRTSSGATNGAKKQRVGETDGKAPARKPKSDELKTSKPKSDKVSAPKSSEAKPVKTELPREKPPAEVEKPKPSPLSATVPSIPPLGLAPPRAAPSPNRVPVPLPSSAPAHAPAPMQTAPSPRHGAAIMPSPLGSNAAVSLLPTYPHGASPIPSKHSAGVGEHDRTAASSSYHRTDGYTSRDPSRNLRDGPRDYAQRSSHIPTERDRREWEAERERERERERSRANRSREYDHESERERDRDRERDRSRDHRSADRYSSSSHHPREERSRDDRPRDERSREERPRDERNGSSSGGRDHYDRCY